MSVVLNEVWVLIAMLTGECLKSVLSIVLFLFPFVSKIPPLLQDHFYDCSAIKYSYVTDRNMRFLARDFLGMNLCLVDNPGKQTLLNHLFV